MNQATEYLKQSLQEITDMAEEREQMRYDHIRGDDMEDIEYEELLQAQQELWEDQQYE